MALNAETIKNTYPLPVYNYRVEINGESIAFSEVSGLSISFETTTYKESRTDGLAGPKVMTMPAQGNSVSLSFKKGIVRGGVSISALYQWINTIQINQVEKKDIRIRLCDEAGAPIINWTVINAFPTKLDAPTFDASSNDVAIESMELMADRVMVEES
jgi:phage tail-like protein